MADITGTLKVSVTTATGSFPVPGADVIISKITENGDQVIYRYITDESGQTPATVLDAPDVQSSLSPTSPGPDYFLYNVTVQKEGFYPIVSLNIPVFEGISSLQSMILIPFTASSGSGLEQAVPLIPTCPGGFGPVCEKEVDNG